MNLEEEESEVKIIVEENPEEHRVQRESSTDQTNTANGLFDILSENNEKEMRKEEEEARKDKEEEKKLEKFRRELFNLEEQRQTEEEMKMLEREKKLTARTKALIKPQPVNVQSRLSNYEIYSISHQRSEESATRRRIRNLLSFLRKRLCCIILLFNSLLSMSCLTKSVILLFVSTYAVIFAPLDWIRHIIAALSFLAVFGICCECLCAACMVDICGLIFCFLWRKYSDLSIVLPVDDIIVEGGSQNFDTGSEVGDNCDEQVHFLS